METLINLQNELLQWLDSECPSIAPPLEPYDNSDLNHNFTELLRIRLDEIEIVRRKMASRFSPAKPDLKELEKRLDDSLAKETKKSLNKFLSKSAKETTSEQKLFILDLLKLSELEVMKINDVKYYSEKSVLLLLKKATADLYKQLKKVWI